MKTIELPDSLTSFNNAFYGCTGLETIIFPDSMTAISGSAFARCTGLKTLELPKSLTLLGARSFKECTALTEVSIPNSISWQTVSDSITVKSGAYYGTTTYYFPSNGAFQGCTALKHVALADGLTSIGNYAFKGCTALTGIELPKGLKASGSGLFPNAAP